MGEDNRDYGGIIDHLKERTVFSAGDFLLDSDEGDSEENTIHADVLIGQIAIRRNFISSEQLRDCLAFQKKSGGRLGSIMLAKNVISRGQLDELLPAQHAIIEEKLRLNGKTPMICRKCGANYNIIGIRSNKVYRCPGCKGVLLAQKSPQTIADTDKIEISDTDERVPNEVRTALGKGAEKVGKFVLMEKIGEGGGGLVYRAYDIELARVVALKLISPTMGVDADRTRNEALLAARLQREGIPRVFETGLIDGLIFIAMEYVEGKPIDRTKFTQTDILRMCKEVAEALDYAHRNGIIHRDIKPSNILIDKTGKVWLIDFGIAKLTTTTPGKPLTNTGDIMGTPHFMSPEQAEGKHKDIDARSDVFSLGSTLYYLLSGTYPFDGANMVEVLDRVIKEDATALGKASGGIPKDVEAIVGKAMEKDRNRRYASARDFAEDIGRYLSGDAIRAKPTGVLDKVTRRIRKNKKISAAVGVAMVAVAIAAALMVAANMEREREKERARKSFETEMGTKEANRQLISIYIEHVRKSTAEALEMRKRGATFEDLIKIPEQTMDLYSRLQAMGVRDADVNYYLGLLYRTIGYPEKAARSQKEAVAINPSHQLAQYELAIIEYAEYQSARHAALRRFSKDFWSQALGSSNRTSPELNPTDEKLTVLSPELAVSKRNSMMEILKALRLVSAGSPEQLTLEALRMLHNQKFDEALRIAKAATSSEQSSIDAWMTLADVQLRRGETSESLATLEKAISVDENNLSLLMSRARIADMWGEFLYRREHNSIPVSELAIEDTTKAIKFKSNHTEAFQIRGTSNARIASAKELKGMDPSRHFALAINDLSRCTELDQSSGTAWSLLACARQNLASYKVNRGEDARSEFLKAIAAAIRATEIEPSNVDGWLLAGVTHLNLATHEISKGIQAADRLKSAIKYLTSAIQIDSSQVEPWMWRGESHRIFGLYYMQSAADPSTEYASAEQDFEMALKLEPSLPYLLTRMAAIIAGRGDFEMRKGRDPKEQFGLAIHKLDDCLGKNPGYSEALQWRSRVYHWQGIFRSDTGHNPLEDFKEALNSIMELVRINPSNAESWSHKGYVHLETGIYKARSRTDPFDDYDAALKSLDNSLKINPRDAVVISQRGRTYGCIAIFLEYSQKDPGDNYEKAMADLTEAIRINASCFEGYFNRGVIGCYYAASLSRRDKPCDDLLRQVIEDCETAIRLRPTSEKEMRRFIDKARQVQKNKDY